MNKQVEKIANRHVARCLSKIEEVFNLPEICANVMRQEIHYTAQDVADYLNQQGDDDDTRGNQ